jgi:hypothetical protein
MPQDHAARGRDKIVFVLQILVGVNRDSFLTSPLGANFDPGGEVVSQG